MNDTTVRERILDSAEARARTGGYHGFSFRDLADDVGIKSASVHYYFPTKADLAEELARRYSARAKEFLGDPHSLAPLEAAARVKQLFADALLKDDRMCLCGLFGAECDALPPAVAEATGGFFRLILNYLSTSFGEDWTGPSPAAILAKLEGALILARTLKDTAKFDEVTTALPGGG